MNNKAMELGMKDTQFKNVSGLPSTNHYSSAYDMAVLARYALNHSNIIEYTSVKQYQLFHRNLKNSNKLLWQYQGADGLKTGYTSEAQHCLTATANRNGLRLITVVMGCSQKDGHFKDSVKLLDYGFNHYSSKSLMKKGYVCGTIKVIGGTINNIKAITSSEVKSIYAKGRENKFRTQIKLYSNIKEPVKKGQKLGEILIFNERELIKKADAVAAQDVLRSGLSLQITGFSLVYGSIALLLLAGTYYFYRRKHNYREK
jgi:D-alanyl-D-alanine carboxypeptidase (penicillin-binding protein 5/6)